MKRVKYATASASVSVTGTGQRPDSCPSHSLWVAQPWPGEVVRLQPWSAFARVITTNGITYCKAIAPDCHNEVALT